MLDTISKPNQDLVNLDLDMKKAEIALCVFIERAFRAKVTNGGSFIVGTNSRYFKGFIEKILKKTNILYSVHVNTRCESFKTHITKPDVFTEYEFVNDLAPQNHATWAYYLDSCKSCKSKEFTNRIRQFYKKAKKLDCNQLAPVFEISQSYEAIKTILLNEHNECNFENSTYLLESFVKFYSVKA
jgi:hypothetical protein